MDVRTEFFLSMAGLGILIITLSVLIYFAVTSGPLEASPDPVPFPVTAIDVSESPQIQNTNTESVEERSFGVIELRDTVVPSIVLNTTDTNLRNSEAEYTVHMHVSWSEILHPDWYPSGAHLSPMVAWSHRLENAVFKPDTVSSDGIESMAETGRTAILQKEIEALGAAGHLLHYGIGKRIDAPGEDTVSIILSVNAPYVSVVSMIAPSPDWFITARNVQLFKDGQWIERVSAPATLYDAGTDSGETFTARNRDTDPRENIAILPNAPSVPIATFEFIRKN